MPPAENARQTLAGWRVLVTRPAPDSQALAARLQDLGADVVQLPLLRIEPLPVSQADESLISDFDRVDIVVVTSRNAARHGVPRLANRWPRWPAGQSWLAVGRGTAEELSAFGIEAAFPADERSEGLLALPVLAHPEGKRVLLLTGSGGRGLIPATLEARGARVVRMDAYRRIDAPVASDPHVARFEDTASAPRAVLVTSAGAMHNLLAQLPLLATDGTWWLVPVERVAESARAAGIRRVRVSGGADDDSMVAAMCELASSGPEERTS